MDFVVRPQSKIDPDEIRARAKQVVQDQRRQKVFFLTLLNINFVLVLLFGKGYLINETKGDVHLYCSFSCQNIKIATLLVFTSW